MDDAPALGSEKVLKGAAVCILIFQIDLACRNPVAKHFNQIIHGHFDRGDCSRYQAVVRPVFIMMFVSSFVVHPGFGIAVGLPLAFVRALVALVELRADEKLRRTVF